MFEADVRAAGLRDTHRLVTRLIGRELAREGLPATTFGALEDQGLIVARTADRSVLGCMNDMAMLCEHAIATSGGLRQADLADLNRALRLQAADRPGSAAPTRPALTDSGSSRDRSHRSRPTITAFGLASRPGLLVMRARMARAVPSSEPL
jgi:hypothetical protein